MEITGGTIVEAGHDSGHLTMLVVLCEGKYYKITPHAVAGVHSGCGGREWLEIEEMS